MIILDLEWNRSYDKKPLDEILQIGAVRVDRLGGPVTDTFSVYIKPSVHKKFDPGAKSLPELQASKDSTVDFSTAMESFRKWCGPEHSFGAWGSGDFRTLAQNCGYWDLPVLAMGKFLDIQRAFSEQVGTNQQVSLHRAVEYCGVPDVFEFHNALHDAMYTAVVASYLDTEHASPGARRGHRKNLHFSRYDFAPQPRRKIGPLATAEEILNARNSRKPVCPLCGAQGSVAHWYYAAGNQVTPRQYYAAFSCPQHGRFLCRLTLTPMENGEWQGRRAVPSITPELVQEYEQALRGKVHECKGPVKRKGRGRAKSGKRIEEKQS
jgi:inhibitor of KinA sporulation pathway (predicted exonuclease)